MFENTSYRFADTLVLNGTVIPNHGLILLEDIGESDAQSLLCLTNHTDCCQCPAIGHWYFPNATYVPNKIINDYNLQWDFYRNRGPSVVRMHRRRGGVTGVYRCKIPNRNGTNIVLYIGVYTNNTGQLTFLHTSASCKLSCFHLTSGAVVVSFIQFQLTSELNATTPTFTLTCTSTGGPATTVTWTVDNHTVTEDRNQSQILTDPETATYNHTLAVTGRLVGWYECSVSNTKSSSNRSLMVVGT